MYKKCQHKSQNIWYLLQCFDIFNWTWSRNLTQNFIEYKSKFPIIQHINNLSFFIYLNLFGLVNHLSDFILKHIHIFFQIFLWITVLVIIIFWRKLFFSLGVTILYLLELIVVIVDRIDLNAVASLLVNPLHFSFLHFRIGISLLVSIHLKSFFFYLFVTGFVFANECANVFLSFNNCRVLHNLSGILFQIISDIRQDVRINDKLIFQKDHLLLVFLLYFI